MKIDYTTYSLKDLLETRTRIDSERYPENFNALVDEIERRRRCGNLHGSNTEHLGGFNNDDEDDEADTFFIDFKSNAHKKRRRFVITAVLAATLCILAFIGNEYWVTSLDNVRQYNTTVSNMRCVVTDVEDEETGNIRRFIDLELSSGADLFAAFDVNHRMCQTIKKEYPSGAQINVWHQDGVIYQLKSDDRMLLSYRLLKPRIRAFQTQNTYLYFFCLICLWMLSFKTFVNALSPGTFTKDDY